MEELKVDVSEEDIRILGFGVDEEYYQWNFIGYVRTKYTAQEIVENKTRGIHASNELKELIFIDYHPEVVAAELREKNVEHRSSSYLLGYGKYLGCENLR